MTIDRDYRSDLERLQYDLRGEELDRRCRLILLAMLGTLNLVIWSAVWGML
jgi:hypothetical protein